MKMLSSILLKMSMLMMVISIKMLMSNSTLLINMPMLMMLSSNISISFIMDWISLLFLSTVMFITSMILKFSTYYINKQEQKQFMMLMMMFVSSMVILIMSNNIFLMLLGWDGLGLSSYILVIYYQDYMTAASGSITLISNRMGDILIILSISMMLMNSNWNFHMNNNFNLMALLLLVTASFSKSAQYPFSAWLPMAMAAPTPISALVHSSTLVTAGVFIMIRMMTNNHPTSMLLLMLMSSATAIYAGMSANWEIDMKKIIALSTLSQIAMMMFAISIKSTMMAFSHLIIHALFKSTMFLCAGIMIHESTYQDMRKLGSNYIMNSPITSSILGISSMTLMGLPFSSGFFSKDAILENMILLKMESLLSMLMIISIGLTASYSIRMSLMSNKLMVKSVPTSKNHMTSMSMIPISLMVMLTIMSGTSMTWLISPQQLVLIPMMLKLKILLLLTIGLILGISLSFSNKKFMKLGKSAITLWYNHITSTSTTIHLSSYMNMYMKNDKMWQETYGPQKSLKLLMYSSTITNLIKNMMLMLMMMMMPLLIK